MSRILFIFLLAVLALFNAVMLNTLFDLWATELNYSCPTTIN